MSRPETDPRFLSLVLAWHAAGLQQLGKVADPRTGRAERDLEGARQTIELLDALERKTQGNLSDDEERTLREALTFLRLNFVDESRKASAERPADGAAGAAPESADGAAEAAPEPADEGPGAAGGEA